jgi:hypothetical protein
MTIADAGAFEAKIVRQSSINRFCYIKINHVVSYEIDNINQY